MTRNRENILIYKKVSKEAVIHGNISDESEMYFEL